MTLPPNQTKVQTQVYTASGSAASHSRHKPKETNPEKYAIY